MHTLLFENGPSLKSCVDRNLSGDWVGTFKPYTKEVTPDFTKKTHTISSIALKKPDYD